MVFIFDFKVWLEWLDYGHSCGWWGWFSKWQTSRKLMVLWWLEINLWTTSWFLWNMSHMWWSQNNEPVSGRLDYRRKIIIQNYTVSILMRQYPRQTSCRIDLIDSYSRWIIPKVKTWRLMILFNLGLDTLPRLSCSQGSSSSIWP